MTLMNINWKWMFIMNILMILAIDSEWYDILMALININ